MRKSHADALPFGPTRALISAARRDSTVGGVLDLTLVTRDGAVGERVALLGDDLAAAAAPS